MRVFIIFLIIVFVVAIIFSSETFPKIWKSFQASLQSTLVIPAETPPKESQKTESATYYSPNPTPSVPPSSAPAKSQPTASIDTYITSGPKEGEIIKDINKVVFEFEAKISPETKESIWFETKIIGFDDDWKTISYYNKRTIELPPGLKEYIFLVRAKTKTLTDPTPASRTFKINTSPYFGKIKISSVQSQSYYGPSLITLGPQFGKDEKINITNWRVKGYKGEIIIPQGIEKYYSDAGREDIIIKQGDIIYLISVSSPLGQNRNFRINKCFGYFLGDYKFYPSFYTSCPKPTSVKEISYLSPICQEFILRLPSCTIPNYSDLRIVYDEECKSYLRDNFSYNACYENHFKDNDFLKNYWYVYVNRDIVTKLHDTLYLLDQNGLVVDKYLY